MFKYPYKDAASSWDAWARHAKLNWMRAMVAKSGTKVARQFLPQWYRKNWKRLDVSPRPDFDSHFYLTRYGDVRTAGREPFEHFVSDGFREGRDPHPLIFTDFVLRQIDAPEDDLEAYFAALEEGVLLNPLMLKPLPSQRLYELLSDNGSDMSAYFTFDYQAWIETQFDVHELYDRHPVHHLFMYGLAGNRLTSAGAIDRPLLQMGSSDLALTDEQLVRQAREPLRNVSFRMLRDAEVDPGAAEAARVTAGIVFYDTPARESRRLLRSLAATRDRGRVKLSVLSLDNSPAALDDLTATLQETGFARAEPRPDNPGFGPGHNILMKRAFKAGAEYYLGLNPDGFMLDDALDRAVAFSRKWDDDALVELESFPIGHPKWHHPVTGVTAWVSGAAFLVPRRLYDEVGGFDPDFPLYGEDVDWSLRVRLAGWNTRVAVGARFYHDIVPRFTEQNPRREMAQLTGTHYLAVKWGLDGRAADLAKAIERLGGKTLPMRSPVQSPTAEVAADLAHERFGVSRFW